MADVLEATYRQNRTETTQSDAAMTKVSRSTYSALASKLSKGTPSQYWVQRFIDKTTITVYPTPDSTAASKDMHIFYVKRLEPQRSQELKLYYEDELARALSEDGSAASTYITPKNYYPNI